MISVQFDPAINFWIVQDSAIINVGPYRLEIPAGFETDLATIPKPLQFLINTFELGTTPPIVHDYIYLKQGVACTDGFLLSRNDCDRIFAILMLQDKVPYWKAFSALIAVRLFGWIWWET